MKNTIRKYIDNVIGNSIYDALIFILYLAVVQIIPAGMCATIKVYFTSNLFATILTSVLLSIIVTFIFIKIYGKIRKFKFRILSMDVKFEYNKEKIVVTTTNTVKSLRRGLNKIYNRYTWFPDEKSRIRCLTKGFYIKRLPRRDTSYEYDVLFNRTVKKGELITYSVRINNENTKGHFNNFYSREIITPIDVLKITLIIPSEYNVKKIYLEEIIGSFRDNKSTRKEIDFVASYEWKIVNPKVGWEYKISW